MAVIDWSGERVNEPVVRFLRNNGSARSHASPALYARARASRARTLARTPRRRNYVSPASTTPRVARSPFRSVLRGFLVFLWPAFVPPIRIDDMQAEACGRMRVNTRGCVRSRTNGASGPFDSSDRKDRKSFDRLIIRNARSKGATD